RFSGPYYENVNGRSVSTLIISKPEPDGTWTALCGVPWQDNVGTLQETEYQLKYLRSGPFDSGKLLLARVDIKRRKRTAGTRSLCGPSDIAIFQGGRTVCERNIGSIEEVVSIDRIFDPNTRKLVIGRSSNLAQYVAFQDVDGVLHQVEHDAEALPDFTAHILGVSAALDTPSEERSNYLLWARDEEGRLAARRLRLSNVDERETGQAQSQLEQVGIELVQTEAGLELDEFLNGPGVVFRAQIPTPRFVALWLSDGKMRWAYSPNGVTGWRMDFKSESLADTLLNDPRLDGHTLVGLKAFEVPMETPEGTIQRVLLLLTTVGRNGTAVSSHTATLARDVSTRENTNLFYHAQVLVEPVTFSGTDLSSQCLESDCLDRRANASLLANLDGNIVLYARTTFDEQFRPQRSPSPQAECGLNEEVEQPLPSEKVWRRIFYRLK
ncbi:MAG: hypothetical protein ACPGQS_09005, partial [Bradymonadia bacterium]